MSDYAIALARFREGTYVTTYCNFPHRIRDGRPVGHECVVLPVAALQAEILGDYERAIQIMRSAGVGAPTGAVRPCRSKVP